MDFKENEVMQQIEIERRCTCSEMHSCTGVRGKGKQLWTTNKGSTILRDLWQVKNMPVLAQCNSSRFLHSKDLLLPTEHVHLHELLTEELLLISAWLCEKPQCFVKRWLHIL
jgi:hypothetical protein